MIVFYSGRTVDHLAAAWAARMCLGSKAEMVCVDPRPVIPLHQLVAGQPAFSACAGLRRKEVIQVNDAAASLMAIEVDPAVLMDLEGYVPSGGQVKTHPLDSAALSVWRHFKASEPAPWLVLYAAPGCDLPDAPKVQAALTSFGADWERWDEVWPLPASELLRIGDAVIRTLIDFQSDAARSAHPQSMFGQRVMVTNFPTGQATQVLEHLAEGAAFAAAWHCTGPGRYEYELVSKPGGADVGELARRMKGSGEPHRAFFTASRQVHAN